MSQTFQIINCRWCNKKVVPDLDTGIYPKKCPNKSCRRQTWNKSDSEIRNGVSVRVKALLKNHKDGKVRWKHPKSTKEDYLTEIKKITRKTFVCIRCELLFENEVLLTRHQLRRNHVVD